MTRVVEFLTTEEVAEHFGISEGTLANWVYQRRVPHHKIGRKVVFTEADISAMVEPVPVLPRPRKGGKKDTPPRMAYSSQEPSEVS